MVSNVLLTGCDAIQEWRKGRHHTMTSQRIASAFGRRLDLPLLEAFWCSPRVLRRAANSVPNDSAIFRTLERSCFANASSPSEPSREHAL